MRLNYDSVRRDAKKLRALADDCEAAAKTCSKYRNELNQYWQGSAADSYAAGLSQLNKKNTALARQIEQLAAQITAVANELEEEDRRLAAQIAAKKISGAASSAKTAASSAGTKTAASLAGTKTTASSTGTKSAAKAASKAAGSAGSAAKKTASKSSSKTLFDAASALISKLFGKG